MSSRLRRGYVDVTEGQLHYQRSGSPQSPALFLLHQTPSTSQMYLPLMALLAEHFDLIALDTPGFGMSDALPEPFTVAAAATALATAAQQLRPGAAFWFGHHTGAALALQIAHDQPQQCAQLALSGPCLLDEQLRQALPRAAADIPLAIDGSHLQQLWQRIAAKDATASAALRQREVLSGAAAGPLYAQTYRAVMAVDTATQLQQLRCPTLVMAGTHDPLFGQLEAAYALLQQGRMAVLDGGNSFACEQQAEQMAKLLLDFFGGDDG